MKKKNKLPTLIAKVLKYAFLIAGAITMLFPFIWMILTAFKTLDESIRIPPIWFPKEWMAVNFKTVFDTAPFGQYFINTVIIATISTLLAVAVTVLASFAFSVLEFKGKKFWFWLFLSTMMVPTELLIIQNYVTVSHLGWLDTYQGIIIPTLASGFYIYMLREYFMQVPPILYKAAKIDGCSDWRYLWKVMVPMSKNAIATISILHFITTWNSFLWPLMVTNSPSKRVLTTGLMYFNNDASSFVNLQMAGACVVILPMVVFYLIFRKQIINGVARGGIKG